MHVEHLAAKINVDSSKLGRSHPLKLFLASIDVHISFLGRTLRLLATNHIFRESLPDVFANNRLSSLLSTKKSFVDLQEKSV
jgi:hypothetical protein